MEYVNWFLSLTDGAQAIVGFTVAIVLVYLTTTDD